jgi:hypothetical protein
MLGTRLVSGLSGQQIYQTHVGEEGAAIVAEVKPVYEDSVGGQVN